MQVRALLAVPLALRVATYGGGDRVVIAEDVLTRSTLGAEEKSLVGIAIGEVVSLGLTGLAASVRQAMASAGTFSRGLVVDSAPRSSS